MDGIAETINLLRPGPTGWGDEMLLAAGVTITLAASATALGIVFGIIGATAKLSHSPLARGIGAGYTTIVRGIPELLVIYLFFFGGSGAVMSVARVFGYTGYIELNAFTIGPWPWG